MATTGVVSSAPFVTRQIIDLAYQRCKVYPAQITPEMVKTAEQTLYLFLVTFGNRGIPSWCVEEIIVPMYAGVNLIQLPAGTVKILDANYRILQPVEHLEVTVQASTYTFDEAQNVTTVGVLWDGTSVATTLQAYDGNAWVTVGTIAGGEFAAGEWSWVDVRSITAYEQFRLTAGAIIEAAEIYLGTQPQEIPMGSLNRDQYSDQTNKPFQSRPTDYYPQRNYESIDMYLWPTPNDESTYAQLVVNRQRHPMTVGNLRQNMEVPLRWYEALIANLAAQVGLTTPTVDDARLDRLERQATQKLNEAWDGDGDGTATSFQVDISPYTR